MKYADKTNHQGAIEPSNTHTENKHLSTFITSLCILGAGLGINLEEANAGMQKTDDGSITVVAARPSATEIKYVRTEQPSADFGKIDGVNQPATNFIKLPGADAHKIITPGADIQKPVPATK